MDSESPGGLGSVEEAYGAAFLEQQFEGAKSHRTRMLGKELNTKAPGVEISVGSR